MAPGEVSKQRRFMLPGGVAVPSRAGGTPCASRRGRTSHACALRSRGWPLSRCLILAAGRFDPVETARAVAADREPRLDVYELCRALSAEVLDFKDVDASASPMLRAARRALGDSAALALLGASRAGEFQSVLTTGEDIGIPFAARLRFARERPSHTMIAHTLFPLKKRIFFSVGKVESCIDRFLCYATS